MNDLRTLYQEVIFDHYRHPRNFHALAGANRHAEGVNPLCGDRVALHLALDARGVIAEAAFEGAGCAISTASASLLTEQLQGKTAQQALALEQSFHAMLTEAQPSQWSALGKLGVLAGVRAFPSRIKCATLAWHALRAALEGRGDVVSTE